MVESGTVIDNRYRVISRVGSGGMADVYVAEDELLGRRVAVKVLHHHFAEDQEFVERFRREASSAAALSATTSISAGGFSLLSGTTFKYSPAMTGPSTSMVSETGAK